MWRCSVMSTKVTKKWKDDKGYFGRASSRKEGGSAPGAAGRKRSDCESGPKRLLQTGRAPSSDIVDGRKWTTTHQRGLQLYIMSDDTRTQPISRDVGEAGKVARSSVTAR